MTRWSKVASGTWLRRPEARASVLPQAPHHGRPGFSLLGSKKRISNSKGAAGDLGNPVSQVTHIPSSTPAGPAQAPAHVPGKGRQVLLPESFVARSHRRGACGIQGGVVTISGDTTGYE